MAYLQFLTSVHASVVQEDKRVKKEDKCEYDITADLSCHSRVDLSVGIIFHLQYT